MKISGYGTVDSTSSAGKRSGASPTSSFADLVSASETSRVSGANEISALASLNNLFALQEVTEEELKRKKLLKQGHNLLEKLEQLRQQLLSGSLPPKLLVDLGRQLAEQKELSMDPRINELIEDIELRAAVELAKLQKAIEDRAARESN